MLEPALKFIEEFIVLPAFANWIALSAFCVSLIGLVWTRRATRISQEALAHAKVEAARSEKLETGKRRFELLCAISNEKALLMVTRLELGVLKANHDADHQTVQVMLGNFSQIFEFLPRIELVVSQLDQLYSDVVALDPTAGPVGFLKLAAEQHRLSKDTEYSVKCVADLLPTFKEKREMAIQAQLRSTRSADET